jgi:hypothetical protein
MLPWVLLTATLVGLLIWQSVREFLEKQQLHETIDHLLEAHRHIAITAKAENATEAQVAIERDLQAHLHTTPQIEPTVEPEPLNNRIQIGGRPFTIMGLDPDQERDFMQSVVGEVTNATPVKS